MTVRWLRWRLTSDKKDGFSFFRFILFSWLRMASLVFLVEHCNVPPSTLPPLEVPKAQTKGRKSKQPAKRKRIKSKSNVCISAYIHFFLMQLT